MFLGEKTMYAGLAFCRRCHTLSRVASDHFIQCRVSAETKARLRAVAEQAQVTESAFLKRLLDLTLNAESVVASVPTPSDRQRHGRRLSVRVRPDDALLLQVRAEARGVAPATYASMFLRKHLQGTAPLPKAELEALRRTLGELDALSRHFRGIALATSARTSEPQADARSGLLATLKACEALRDHIHALVAANLRSWAG